MNPKLWRRGSNLVAWCVREDKRGERDFISFQDSPVCIPEINPTTEINPAFQNMSDPNN